MKYIRTKDGEILRVPFTKEEYNDAFPYTNLPYEKWFNLWVYDVEIIKQTDTIKELCDEFVAVGIPFRTFVVDLKEIKRSGLDIHSFSRACYMQYENCAIYGAIWTDKGLIYVAKMNDKGELELL